MMGRRAKSRRLDSDDPGPARIRGRMQAETGCLPLARAEAGGQRLLRNGPARARTPARTVARRR